MLRGNRCVGLALIAGLLGVAFPNFSSADVVAIDVTKANIKRQPLEFAVKTEKRPSGVHFAFSVAQKNELSPYHDAGIVVRDAAKTVVECRLKPFRKEGSISYEFTMAPEHAAHSQFILFNIGGNGPVPFPSGTIYRFSLKEFYQQEAEADDGNEQAARPEEWQALDATFAEWRTAKELVGPAKPVAVLPSSGIA